MSEMIADIFKMINSLIPWTLDIKLSFTENIYNALMSRHVYEKIKDLYAPLKRRQR